MDGKVVVYAQSFVDHNGLFGSVADAMGPFEVSASRNAVIVHRAECKTPEQVDSLIEAIRAAEQTMRSL
jgi:hypothetical protein